MPSTGFQAGVLLTLDLLEGASGAVLSSITATNATAAAILWRLHHLETHSRRSLPSDNPGGVAASAAAAAGGSDAFDAMPVEGEQDPQFSPFLQPEEGSDGVLTVEGHQQDPQQQQVLHPLLQPSYQPLAPQLSQQQRLEPPQQALGLHFFQSALELLHEQTQERQGDLASNTLPLPVSNVSSSSSSSNGCAVLALAAATARLSGKIADTPVKLSALKARIRALLSEAKALQALAEAGRGMDKLNGGCQCQAEGRGDEMCEVGPAVCRSSMLAASCVNATAAAVSAPAAAGIAPAASMHSSETFLLSLLASCSQCHGQCNNKLDRLHASACAAAVESATTERVAMPDDGSASASPLPCLWEQDLLVLQLEHQLFSRLGPACTEPTAQDALLSWLLAYRPSLLPQHAGEGGQILQDGEASTLQAVPASALGCGQAGEAGHICRAACLALHTPALLPYLQQQLYACYLHPLWSCSGSSVFQAQLLAAAEGGQNGGKGPEGGGGGGRGASGGYAGETSHSLAQAVLLAAAMQASQAATRMLLEGKSSASPAEGDSEALPHAPSLGGQEQDGRPSGAQALLAAAACVRSFLLGPSPAPPTSSLSGSSGSESAGGLGSCSRDAYSSALALATELLQMMQ